MNKAYEIKSKRMQYSYSGYRKEWEDTTDDRKVFCNIYDKLMEALEVMKDIDNNTIWCGFHKVCDEDFKMMDEIVARFS